VKDSITDSFRNLLNRGFPTYLRKYPEMAPFYDVQYRQIFQRFTDVELIYKLLPDNTRSTVFRYDIEHPLEESFKIVCNKPGFNENTQSQSIDLENYLKIYASYFQFGQLDIPLRIEFLAKDDLSEIESRIQLISRIIPPISRPNPTCTIPIPQIEAHLRVHLREQEMDLFVNQLHRDFKIRQIGLWHIKQQGKPVLSEDFSSFAGLIFEGSDDFKSLYSTFLPNRHNRFPF
jgi:hypothetical protein